MPGKHGLSWCLVTTHACRVLRLAQAWCTASNALHCSSTWTWPVPAQRLLPRATSDSLGSSSTELHHSSIQAAVVQNARVRTQAPSVRRQQRLQQGQLVQGLAPAAPPPLRAAPRDLAWLDQQSSSPPELLQGLVDAAAAVCLGAGWGTGQLVVKRSGCSHFSVAAA